MNIIEAIFREVLDVSWRLSLVVVAAFAVRALFGRRIPARLMFGFWIVIAIRAAVPLSFEASWSPFRRVVPSVEPTAIAPNEQGSIVTSPGEASHDVRSPQEIAPSVRPAANLYQWAAIMWLVGVVALSATRAIASAHFKRSMRSSRSPVSMALVEVVSSEAARHNMPAPDAWESDAVEAPVLHGLFRPQLLFPRGMSERLSRSALRMIVAHELSHLARRDLVSHALFRAMVVLHWFNPIVWLAARIARDDCELACDERTLRHLTDVERRSYGATLIDLANWVRCSQPPPLALGIVDSKQHLKRRINMIAHPQQSAPIRATVGVVAFLTFAVASLSEEATPRSAKPIQPVLAEASQPVRGPAASQTVDPAHEFRYGDETDGLDSLYPDGVVASVGDRRITVEEVRLQVRPLVPELQRTSLDQGDFDRRVRMLHNDVIQSLVKRLLYLKQFRESSKEVPERHVAAEFVDKAIADQVKEQFGGNPQKLAEWVSAHGMTMETYRKAIEEDIIYSYMRAQERKALGPSGRVEKAKEFPSQRPAASGSAEQRP